MSVHYDSCLKTLSINQKTLTSVSKKKTHFNMKILGYLTDQHTENINLDRKYLFGVRLTGYLRPGAWCLCTVHCDLFATSFYIGISRLYFIIFGPITFFT